MARPYWSGQVQISLVSFGVKLFVATESKSEIHFHQIDRATGERVRHQKVLASTLEATQSATASVDEPAEPVAPPVQQSQIVKGFEYAKGQYVTIEPEELAHLRVPSKHTMAVEQFVNEAELSPEFFEKPYFVVPENEAQTEAFATVRQALLDTKKVALTKIAFGGREHVVALSPAGHEKTGGMMAYTMRYAAELRPPSEYFRDIKAVDVNEDSLALAMELIKRKSAPYDASRFVDGYEVAVKELVDAKLQHTVVPRDEEPAPARGKVINLMDALRKSVGSATASPDREDVESERQPTAKGGAAPKAARLTKPKSGKSEPTPPKLGPSLVPAAAVATKPPAKVSKTPRRKSA